MNLRLEQKERELARLLAEMKNNSVAQEEAKLDQRYKGKVVKRAGLALETMTLRIQSAELLKQRAAASLKISALTQKLHQLRRQYENQTATLARAKDDLERGVLIALFCSEQEHDINIIILPPSSSSPSLQPSLTLTRPKILPRENLMRQRKEARSRKG